MTQRHTNMHNMYKHKSLIHVRAVLIYAQCFALTCAFMEFEDSRCVAQLQLQGNSSEKHTAARTSDCEESTKVRASEEALKVKKQDVQTKKNVLFQIT